LIDVNEYKSLEQTKKEEEEKQKKEEELERENPDTKRPKLLV